jgi:hypothetical protein
MLAADMIGFGATTIPGQSSGLHESEMTAVETDSAAVNLADSDAGDGEDGSEMGVAGLGGAAANTAIRLPSIFVAPDTIVADSQGHFSYQAVFTAGHDNPDFAYYQQQNVSNTDVPGLVADGFCLSTIPQGEQFIIEVSGSLLKPTMPGQVQIEFGTCNPYHFFSQVTTIRPALKAAQPTMPTATVHHSKVAGNSSLEMVVNADGADLSAIHESSEFLPTNTFDTNAGQLGDAHGRFRGRMQSTSSSELASASWTSRLVDAVMAEVEIA